MVLVYHFYNKRWKFKAHMAAYWTSRDLVFFSIKSLWNKEINKIIKYLSLRGWERQIKSCNEIRYSDSLIIVWYLFPSFCDLFTEEFKCPPFSFSRPCNNWWLDGSESFCLRIVCFAFVGKSFAFPVRNHPLLLSPIKQGFLLKLSQFF